MSQSVTVSAVILERGQYRFQAVLDGCVVGHATACVAGPDLLIRELDTKGSQEGEEITQALFKRAISQLGGGCRQAIVRHPEKGDSVLPLTGAAKAMDIQGVIFDMDGLLLDTETLYLMAWPEVGEAMGLTITQEAALETIGTSHEEHERIFQRHYGPAFCMEKAMDILDKWLTDYVAQNGLPIKAGAVELLQLLREKGIPVAIGSSNYKYVVEAYLEATGLGGYFKTWVAGDMVPQKKPEPDIFLRAAQELQAPPARCLVLEDSMVGALAAYRAGCIPGLVPDLITPDDATYGRIWRSFSSLEQLPLALF